MKISQPAMGLALVLTGVTLGSSLAEGSRAATPKRSGRPTVRRGGASPSTVQVQQIGEISYGASGPKANIQYMPLKTGGMRLTLEDDAFLQSPTQTITAEIISIDVAKIDDGNAKNQADIKIARASGNVHFKEIQPDGRTMTADGQSLIYNRMSGIIDMAGGVRVHSDLLRGGTVDATGKTAQMNMNPNTKIAKLMTDVELTLTNPDLLVGPGKLYGQVLTLNRDTGIFDLSGGGKPTKGSFNLKPQPKPDKKGGRSQ